ncbi:MAG: hypothetical protein HYX60_09040 [Legionella longbeachae]|nr:hypothetical protein [Legionella longbeachae]
MTLKILAGGLNQYDKEVKDLKFPVPVEESSKWRAVPMSVGKGEWVEVDLTDKAKNWEGIYTDGLTACAAIAIVKFDEQNKISKVWMYHIEGGFNEDKMPNFPKGLIIMIIIKFLVNLAIVTVLIQSKSNVRFKKKRV